MPTPKTLDKYPAEFFQVWELAKQNRLSLNFPTRSLATSIRQRLYAFRKLLAQQQGPVEGAKLYNVDLLILEKHGQWLLMSHIPEWKQQVRSAALATSPSPSPSPEEIALAPPLPVEIEGQDTLSKTLGNLGFGTKD